jgi:AcrR family transcriptional regulator
MARRSEHTQDQIKDMILNAAEAIIIEEGVDALTVRKVAQEIGYTVGSFYMVFTNMEELMTHLKARTLDHLCGQLRTVSQIDEPEKQIHGLSKVYLNYAAENFNRWRFVFENSFLDQADMPDWYRQKVKIIFEPIEELFKKLKPDIEDDLSNLAARSLWCGVHGICILSLNGHLDRAGIQNSELAVDMLVKNFILGWKQD